jgi:triosephosphate isomerase
LSRPALTIGVSLKMYFGRRQTVEWCRAVARLAARHPLVARHRVELFVLPAAPMIDPVLGIFMGTPVRVGAQNLYAEDSGAFTGEVSGALLREMGCHYAEVGHAERRRLFGEDNAAAAAKVAACWRNELIPVLCVGEPSQSPPDQAAATCVVEAREILEQALDISASLASSCGGSVPQSNAADDSSRRVILAYEPHWAIGRAEPAPVQHIREVTAGLGQWLATREEFTGGRVIYGGSAGPGLLTSISDSTDGLFLGRFAHDPAVVDAILDEAQAIATLAERSGTQSAQRPDDRSAQRPDGPSAGRPDNPSGRKSGDRSRQRLDDKGVTWLSA